MNKAILLVHGVGNAVDGSYDPLIQQLRDALGPQADQYAIYFLYYDQINNWFATKTQAAALVSKFMNVLHLKAAGEQVAKVAADFAGDVVWPILVADARLAVRAAYLAQLQQIVEDGLKKNSLASDLELSIICHSLGCFHTYEVLHEAASKPGEGLSPYDGVYFKNVVFMASPVQMIRSVAQDMGVAIPDQKSLRCAGPDNLAIPSALIGAKSFPSVLNWVSITGNLDPVGGYFFRHRADWAYMNVPTQKSFIDQQEILKDIHSAKELEMVLLKSIQEKTAPKLEPQNPHDWSDYLTRHSTDLKTWLT